MICYQVGGDPVRIMWSVRKTTTENYCTQGIPLGEVLELFLKDVCSRFENIVSDIFISGLVSMSRTTHNTKTFWCFAVVCDNSPLPPQKKLLMWNMSLRSSSSDTRRRSVARFQGLGGKISFWGWKIFVFILCFSQIFVGATKFLGELQARRQDLAAGGAKNQKGSHIFKILYWMYAATRGPNVKWGVTDFKWGGRAPLAPPLVTARELPPWLRAWPAAVQSHDQTGLAMINFRQITAKLCRTTFFYKNIFCCDKLTTANALRSLLSKTQLVSVPPATSGGGQLPARFNNICGGELQPRQGASCQPQTDNQRALRPLPTPSPCSLSPYGLTAARALKAQSMEMIAHHRLLVCVRAEQVEIAVGVEHPGKQRREFGAGRGQRELGDVERRERAIRVGVHQRQVPEHCTGTLTWCRHPRFRQELGSNAWNINVG